MKGCASGAFALLFAVFALCAPAQGSETLWKRLAQGGQVVMIRHTITSPGVGDPPGMRLDDCATQRNLTDEGRRHAREIGAAFSARSIPIDSVLASPWCRCLETARLAFGRAEVSQPLGNLFGRPGNQPRQVRELKALAGALRRGGNLVLVTHGSTIAALTGISPGTGELVILTPRGNGEFEVAGRMTVHTP